MCLRRRAEVDSGSSSSSCSESCSWDGEEKEESGMCCGPTCIWGSVGEGRRLVVDLDLGGICSYEIIVARCVPARPQPGNGSHLGTSGLRIATKESGGIDLRCLFGGETPRTSCVERECHQRQARSSLPANRRRGESFRCRQLDRAGLLTFRRCHAMMHHWRSVPRQPD
jgi:hypothetical protein